MFQKIMNLFKPEKKSVETTIISTTNTLNPNGKPEDVSSRSLVERYKSWAYICATKNASCIADTPLRLYATRATGENKRRVSGKTLSKDERKQLEQTNPRLKSNMRFKTAEEVEEIYEHPFIKLMENINPDRGKFETFEETSIFLDITGNCYWLLDLNNLNVPQYIYIMPSQNVRIEPGKDILIKDYIYGNGLEKKVIPPELVCHFKNPNPKDMYYGMGCLQAVIETSDLMDAYNLEEQALNRNKGIPPTIWKYTGGNLKSDELRRLEGEINNMVSGIANRGKNKVVDGDWDIKQLSFSPSEMQYMEGRKWGREEIADAFGVPMALISVENVNRAVAREANYAYQKFSIKPRLTRISERINERILPFYNEPRLFVMFDDNVPADVEIDTKNAVALFQAGIIDKNEARVTAGYEETKDNGGLVNEEDN